MAANGSKLVSSRLAGIPNAPFNTLSLSASPSVATTKVVRGVMTLAPPGAESTPEKARPVEMSIEA